MIDWFIQMNEWRTFNYVEQILKLEMNLSGSPQQGDSTAYSTRFWFKSYVRDFYSQIFQL